MRIYSALLAITFLLMPTAYGYEIGQSIGIAQDYADFGVSGSGRAVATLSSVEKYDVPEGGFSVELHWTNKTVSWDSVYAVQCTDNGAGATPSVFDFDAPDGGKHYAIKQTASYFTEQEAFMHKLYREVCRDIPGTLLP